MIRKLEDGSPESGALPPPPVFGEPVPIVASAEVLSFLARRRSASALSLGDPGPSETQLQSLLALAARVPDHGKLAPWRFIILAGAEKSRFVERLEATAGGRADGPKLLAKLGKLRAPPLTIAVVSRCLAGDIPEWEQRLSAGAVCMVLVTAAQAMGFGANWITDWYAYDREALDLLGVSEGEKIAGFVHIGTAADAPLERARPAIADLVSVWGDQRPR
jgi:nitroreductase